MNKMNVPEKDLDSLLKRTLKDDLPPDAEARMNRQFLRLKGTLHQTVRSPEPDGWLWLRGPFPKEILAMASAAMIILGFVMQLGGTQSALAHSIEKLKVIISMSSGLNRASSMDCAVLKTGAAGIQTSYNIRWRAPGEVRVDIDPADDARTLWISGKTVSVAGPRGGNVRSGSLNVMTSGSVWQPALEFASPKVLAQHMEEHYGLMQSGGRSGNEGDEFLIVGRVGRQDIEITVDAKTYLPKALKKYSQDPDRTNGGRNCVMEARFLWNQPIPEELFRPRTPVESPR